MLDLEYDESISWQANISRLIGVFKDIDVQVQPGETIQQVQAKAILALSRMADKASSATSAVIPVTSGNIADVTTDLAVGTTHSGYEIEAGDLILVREQTNTWENGIYDTTGNMVHGDTFYGDSATIGAIVFPRGKQIINTDNNQFSIGDGVTAGGVSVGSGGQGLEECVAASLTNINLASNAPATIDGVTLAADDLILLKDQTDPTENGIYAFTSTATPLTRGTDYDEDADFADKGLVFFVSGGTVNGNRLYSSTNADTFTLDTDNLVFKETSAVFAALTGYSPAQLSDFETTTPTDVDTAKKALDILSSIQTAKVREDVGSAVYSELRNRVIRNSETGELFLVIGDGATAVAYRINAVLEARTAPIPGANPTQSTVPHVSSPDGSVLELVKVGNNFRAFYIPGDGSAKIEFALGIAGVIDADENFDIEYTDVDNVLGLGPNEKYSVITGDSDSLGANGQPIVMGLQAVGTSGANPFAQTVGGRGQAVRGQLLNRRAMNLRGFLDTLLSLRESTQDGEIGFTSEGKVGTATIRESGFWNDTITATADNGGFCRYTVGDTTDLRVGDTLRVSSHAAAGDQKVTAIDSATEVTTDAAFQAGTSGGVYALARISLSGVNTELSYSEIFERQEAGVYVASDNNSIVIMSPDGTYFQAFGERRTSPVPGATPDQQVIPHIISDTGSCLLITGKTVEVIDGQDGTKATLGAIFVDTGEQFDAEAAFDVDNLMGLGSDEAYSYITGNSDSLDINGTPIVQGGHKPAAGAAQPRQTVGSGRASKGPQALRVPLAVTNYKGDIDEFLKIAQEGEICKNDTASVIVGVTAPANKFYACIKDAGRIIDGTAVVATITASADNAGDIQFTCSGATDLTVNVNVNDIIFVQNADGDSSELGQHKVKAVTATTITVETNWHAGSASTAGSIRLDALVEQITSTTI